MERQWKTLKYATAVNEATFLARLDTKTNNMSAVISYNIADGFDFGYHPRDLKSS